MAGAYTVFANGGTRMAPLMVKSVRDVKGNILNNYHPDSKEVLDPRVAYVMTTMMEAVVNNGTGYPVRARGFTAPAAGKTGTSHDAWFAGYTTEPAVHRMGGERRLHRHQAGRRRGGRAHLGGVHEARGQAAAVRQHEGISRTVGRGQRYAGQSDQPAGDGRPAREDYTVAFIAGTEPKETCDQAFGDHRGFFTKIFGLGSPP